MQFGKKGKNVTPCMYLTNIFLPYQSGSRIHQGVKFSMESTTDLDKALKVIRGKSSVSDTRKHMMNSTNSSIEYKEIRPIIINSAVKVNLKVVYIS